MSPPTTVFSVTHSNLLLLCPCSHEVDSLAVLEFLYRVIDAFEDFLGSPLLANKIEENYEIAAQLLNELCDNGIICNTETNSLRDSIEVSSVISKLLTQVGLPGTPPALGPSITLSSGLRPQSAFNSGPAIPWRRANVRHTSNELYVDMVESLSVILAPSGRPISARVNGSIAFTAKISGVPDLLLNLSAPGGSSLSKGAGIARTMQIPTFHPCVRLAKWRENPGELSFVPPDGRFMLAGYEVDLLPSSANTEFPPNQQERLFLPATVDIRTGLGPTGLDFEARLTLSNNFPGVPSVSKPSTSSRSVSSNPFSFGSASSSSGGNSNTPTLENVIVAIPLPEAARNVTELKPSRGEASFNTWTKTVEWKLPSKDKEVGSLAGTAVLTGSVLGPVNPADESVGVGGDDVNGGGASEAARANQLAGYYDEDSPVVIVPHHPDRQPNGSTTNLTATNGSAMQSKRKQTNRSLLPRSASVSFTVRGWLPSGIKVESLMVDVKKSRGLGEGVKPFKGVKYVTVSKRGVERRAS